MYRKGYFNKAAKVLEYVDFLNGAKNMKLNKKLIINTEIINIILNSSMVV